MISCIFIILAAICNAVMDTCQHHYEQSIFTKYNQQFWDAKVSWKNKYVDWDNGDKRRVKILGGRFNLPVSFTDSWHLFKRLMLIFIALAVVTIYKNTFFLFDLALVLVFWNATFHLFYHTLLIKKS